MICQWGIPVWKNMVHEIVCASWNMKENYCLLNLEEKVLITDFRRAIIVTEI